MALIHLDEAKSAWRHCSEKVKPRKIPKFWIYYNFNVGFLRIAWTKSAIADNSDM